MRRISFLPAFAAFSLTLTGPVSGRSLEMIEGAYEAVLADVTFPARPVGNLIVRPCTGCDPVVLSVDASTVYETSAGPVTLPELMDLVDGLRRSAPGAGTAVTVFFALDSNKVTRSVVHIDAPGG
jgi:hypothetical protein